MNARISRSPFCSYFRWKSSWTLKPLSERSLGNRVFKQYQVSLYRLHINNTGGGYLNSGEMISTSPSFCPLESRLMRQTGITYSWPYNVWVRGVASPTYTIRNPHNFWLLKNFTTNSCWPEVLLISRLTRYVICIIYCILQ